MRTQGKDMVWRLLMAALLVIAGAQAGMAQDVTFRTYKDVAGFSCEFPSDWDFDQARNFDRIFTSAKAPDATIIIQVIEQDKAAEKTVAGQLEALKQQLLRAPDGRILNEGTAPIAGQQVPYLVAGYTALDTADTQRAFRHIQMVVTTPRAFLLMSYSAPDESFDREMRVFQNCSATLQIEAAGAAAPPVSSQPAPEQPAPQPPAAPEGQAQDTEVPDAVAPGSEETLIWRHNTDRDFWIAVPSIWSNKADQSEPYSVDMQHPDRVEGVIVFVVDMNKTSKVKEYANAWELVLADKIFFMKDRLAVPQKDHPGVGVAKTPGIMREYQGEINGATVRSVAAYVVNKKRGFTVVGYHFLGDAKGEKRIRAAVESFRLAAP
ncbi:conserved exported hypothetical protein [Hoeflea sp. EC-HK425]|nr:conserved exported hypothetical protein [Hoeflea sp. EC-HK425]|tara:strand:+ start:446 stop:1579 length:1134 start_codon:yes stop_codon:yes gene_type:complete